MGEYHKLLGDWGLGIGDWGLKRGRGAECRGQMGRLFSLTPCSLLPYFFPSPQCLVPMRRG
ncbi:hypothetical protein FD723_16705 [Nostoc sp. C052]|nr:hypothetical protein FD723_16705 [Nostoc sp. C052]